MTNAANAAEIDKSAAQWLRERHPNWSDAKISRTIIRSRVIEDHPNWSDAQIDAETAQREKDLNS